MFVRRVLEIFEARMHIKRIFYVGHDACSVMEFDLDPCANAAFFREHIDFMRGTAAVHRDFNPRAPSVRAQDFGEKALKRIPGRSEIEDGAFYRVARGDRNILD